MTFSLDARINLDRLLADIERSAQIGVGREGGLSRLALSDADREMRDLFVGWCQGANLSISVDEVGNIFGRRAGWEDDLPPVLVGSHLDTQANGGRFDGILGALEVVRTLNDLGHVTKRPIEIVSWTNEEGARFSPPMLASGCFAGAYPVDWAYERQADDGATFGAELERVGYRGSVPAGWRIPDAYLELHIEQGPILDAEKVQVGVVTHAYRSHGFLIEFHGQTAHTGPWPMEKRRNALVAAARLLVGADDIGWEFASSGGKATAARLVAWPNKTGILSDWSQAVCDVRHDDPTIADNMADKVAEAAEIAAWRSGCDVEVLDRWTWGGPIFDEDLVRSIRSHAGSLGYSHRDLPSQARHDAYFLARICPAAMIFTPCRNGVTHNNTEYAAPEDIAPGANVLLHALVARADR